MRKWTTGPWSVDAQYPSVINGPPQPFQQYVIATVYRDNMSANACLIAAAPKIDEALEDCATALRNSGAGHPDSAYHEQWLNAVAALNEAYGS